MARIIITTGGTGGHIFPALATCDALKELIPDAELLFLGGLYGSEERFASAAHIPFIGLPGKGILGKGLRAIPATYDNLRAFIKAINIIRSFHPCAVAAFGGYASFAPGLAAALLRLPLLLHEQNAIAGTTIRLLSRFANTICISLPQTAHINKPVVFTGNPVRKNIAPRQGNSHSKHLLVLGGSQGAHAINEAIYPLLPALAKVNIQIIHQTGPKDFQKAKEIYFSAGLPLDSVQAFINDMASAYQWADLAVCRAGASTIAELCIADIPSILIPFPAAIHDHQTINAKILVQAGAALIIPETEISQLLDKILYLFSNPQILAQMSRACLSLARPDAALRVAQEIQKLCTSSQFRQHEK